MPIDRANRAAGGLRPPGLGRCWRVRGYRINASLLFSPLLMAAKGDGHPV